MDLDTETMARFLGAICRQAIRDDRNGWHEPGYPEATTFVGFCLCDTKSHPERERVVPLPASAQAGSQPQARRW